MPFFCLDFGGNFSPRSSISCFAEGGEEAVGRPLTVVVVDEAHGIGATGRGLKLEVMLATINRECHHAQFLLLTPFIRNAAEVSRWLAPESNKNIVLGLDSSDSRSIVVPNCSFALLTISLT